jgi:restriction endonuclease S subunit
VSESGLKLEDVKYIKLDTHNGMLKRSQVREGDLLTKITGVGRMAVSSVAPKGFEGNINQHLVVIKTNSPKTSEVLAAFLNSDIGERLAFRRSTGGTRPALDYEALKSIPIVFEPKILEIMQAAYDKKKQKEKEAEELLSSIDDYVLGELGIEMPEMKEKQCYAVDFSEIESRIDPYYYQPMFERLEKILKNGKYKPEKLGDFITKMHYGISIKNIYVEKGIPLLRICNVQPNKIDLSEVVSLDESTRKNIGSGFVNEGDILISRSGSVGISAVVPKEAEGYAFGSFMIKFCVNENINKEYVSIWLNNKISKLFTEREKIGAIQGNITISTIEGYKIPLPSLKQQEEIVKAVKSRMTKAEAMNKEAIVVIEQAKKEVEGMILGDSQ